MKWFILLIISQKVQVTPFWGVSFWEGRCWDLGLKLESWQCILSKKHEMYLKKKEAWRVDLKRFKCKLLNFYLCQIGGMYYILVLHYLLVGRILFIYTYIYIYIFFSFTQFNPSNHDIFLVIASDIGWGCCTEGISEVPRQLHSMV